jgi:hypothetical protein
VFCAMITGMSDETRDCLVTLALAVVLTWAALWGDDAIELLLRALG